MPLVKKYKSVVVEKKNLVEGLITVSFSCEKRITFLPGQFLHLTLEQYDGIGQWPESRCFSIQSTPSEEILKITFAVKGSFTKRMEKELKPGKIVWLKLPYGDMFQRNFNKENCTFIAGGTGVTPFLSLFNDVSFKEFKNPRIYLGFRNKNYNIYKDELNNIQNLSSIVNVFYENIDGKLDIDRIYNDNIESKTYFISGPPIMIKNFKQFLIIKGLNPDLVITDDWE